MTQPTPGQPFPGPNTERPGPDFRCCQYCGKTAEVFDVDGAWCTTEHQRYDRQSEITIWRQAVGA